VPAFYEMLWDELEACGGTVLVVLDEVDHVEDDSILSTSQSILG